MYIFKSFFKQTNPSMWLEPESIQPSTWSYCHHKFGWLCFFKIVSSLQVICPRYCKHWLSTVAIDCVCFRILNCDLNHGLFFWWKNILNYFENSGLKSRFLFCLIFQFYLMYRLICRKPFNFCLPTQLWWAYFFKCLWYLGCITLWTTYRLNPELKRKEYTTMS